MSPSRAPRFLLIAAATILGGCTLHRLPEPSIATCSPTDPPSLWKCLSAIPPESRTESAFTSTLRVSDAARKGKDQELPSACEGPTPPGFALRHADMDDGRAPLIALVAPPPEGSSPIVLVVHGVFDSKHTRYVQVTGELLRREGFGVVIPDMRWHGCLLDRKWLPTLGVQEGPDLVAWGRWLAREYPGHPIGLLGFSMGGTSVLHAMGDGDAAEVFRAGAMAVCPAAALPRVLQHLDAKLFSLDSGMTVVFRRGFRSYLRARTKPFGRPPEGDTRFASFLEWLVQARPEIGPTVPEFLARADPAPSVVRSGRPLLILVTANDPVIPVSANDDLVRAVALNPRTFLIETPFGGHIGQPGTMPNWFASVVTTFFRLSPGV